MDTPDTLHLTSPPRGSSRNPGYVWVYYSDQTSDGRACGALVPAWCASRLYKGMEFDRSQLTYDEQLGSEVLALLEQPPLQKEPSQPPFPERGWADADGITATAPAQTVARSASLNGTRGPAHRKAAAATESVRIPADLLQLLETAACSYNYVRIRIGATDPARSDHARALAITALIAYTRQQGALIPGDEPVTADALEKILASQA